MAVNRDKPDRWKGDIAQSVDMYNDWFLEFAPDAYRTTRVQTTRDVEATLEATANLTDIGITLLRRNPGVLPTLRMATCPPLAGRPSYRAGGSETESGEGYGKGRETAISNAAPTSRHGPWEDCRGHPEDG